MRNPRKMKEMRGAKTRRSLGVRGIDLKMLCRSWLSRIHQLVLSMPVVWGHECHWLVRCRWYVLHSFAFAHISDGIFKMVSCIICTSSAVYVYGTIFFHPFHGKACSWTYLWCPWFDCVKSLGISFANCIPQPDEIR